MKFQKIEMIMKVFEEKWDLVFKTWVCCKREWFFENKNCFNFKGFRSLLKKNESLKIDIVSHVCHASVASPSLPIACSTLSSSIKNDINVLKKSVDCLGSTLSHCALNHIRLESMFRKKQVPLMHAHKPRHTHALHVHTYNTMYANVYTLWT